MRRHATGLDRRPAVVAGSIDFFGTNASSERGGFVPDEACRSDDSDAEAEAADAAGEQGGQRTAALERDVWALAAENAALKAEVARLAADLAAAAREAAPAATACTAFLDPAQGLRLQPSCDA